MVISACNSRTEIKPHLVDDVDGTIRVNECGRVNGSALGERAEEWIIKRSEGAIRSAALGCTDAMNVLLYRMRRGIVQDERLVCLESSTPVTTSFETQRK